MSDPARPVTEIAFLEAEIEYWRDKAFRLDARLAELERAARDAQRERHGDLPPEPPVGTRFYIRNLGLPVEGTGELRWQRTEHGWECPNPECDRCPVEWPVVVAFARRYQPIRRWPGELAPPNLRDLPHDGGPF